GRRLDVAPDQRALQAEDRVAVEVAVALGEDVRDQGLAPRRRDAEVDVGRPPRVAPLRGQPEERRGCGIQATGTGTIRTFLSLLPVSCIPFACLQPHPPAADTEPVTRSGTPATPSAMSAPSAGAGRAAGEDGPSTGPGQEGDGRGPPGRGRLELAHERGQAADHGLADLARPRAARAGHALEDRPGQSLLVEVAHPIEQP